MSQDLSGRRSRIHKKSMAEPSLNENNSNSFDCRIVTRREKQSEQAQPRDERLQPHPQCLLQQDRGQQLSEVTHF